MPEHHSAQSVAALLRKGRYAANAIDPASTDPLVALFRNGRKTEATSIDADAVDALLAAGLIERRDDQVVPLARITPWGELLIVHDPDRPGELVDDTVLGVNNTTRTLAHLTPRRAVRRALDVATGSAGPALLLTDHADTVVATDLSERAITYARFNAALNGRNLELRAGSLFDPVADDEPFDLVSANLPFVVSPDSTFVFRDGGRPGDELCREAVIGASRHLSNDGTAILLCSWLVPADTEPTAPVVGWLDDHDGAALVIHHTTVDPEAYARRWNEYLLVQDPAAYTPTIDRWVAAHERWGAVGVATGAVMLRRGTAKWARSLTMTAVPQGDGGKQLERIVANVDRLLAVDPSPDGSALVDARLALVSSHRLEQAMRYDGGWTVDDVGMVLDDSAGIPGVIDPLAVHVLLRLDGAHTVGELTTAVASELGLDEPTLRNATVATCRALLEAGCLDWPA